MDRCLGWLDRLFSFLMVACLALMVVMVFGNVVLRYAFNSGITMSEELSRWLFVWMTFLGSVVAMRRHSHLGSDALVARLPLVGKKICFVAAHGLMLAMCVLMAKGAWDQVVINYGSTSPVMQLSMAWFHASALLFAVLAAVIIVFELFKLAMGRVEESELVGVVESEEAQ
ncbi:MAG TPA: TRAP transporter small permease [Ramlibacter sp.]|nr:TRAP transporter small permease [Ramlibacter sp.]